ncbi:hypothetical protein CAI18_13595 [Xanthomonas citri pv. punicae]|uniref:Uncharacterized protein n=1 Tax=Xanthomonas campestris pv. malvacearum TaxID=86040 RepID=A0AA45BTU7_XANCM|nr:hypothetical protein CIW71_12370 [Xanthomonas citri pv. malvacearum]NMI15450.1 hypothetical protein [Xanthomonas citri]QCZ64522.1 hypothetical protein CAI14_07580 [Xanthomonas citri pv. punicae]CCF70206.1 putative uncharacterized protein [Xanthomonas citri pv. punicae str. LMG 859]ASY88947.1 hypothetical protein CIW72_11765 [Xanthomonas citri pv. malvacearum]
MAHRHRCEVARQPSGLAHLQRVLQPRRWRAWCQPSVRETRGFRAFSPVHGHRIDIPSYRLRAVGTQDAVSAKRLAVRHSHAAVNEKAPDMPGPFFYLSRSRVRDIITCVTCSTAASAAIRTASAGRRWH